MPAFTGQLNANEIYLAIFNFLISMQIFDIDLAEPTLANALRVDGTLYGDTKTFYSMDIQGNYPWGNDAEAPRLLNLNRNRSQKVQSITLDTFRQAFVTTDNVLSKRGFSGEGNFSQFNGIIKNSISQSKSVYDNGLINTFIGTQRSSAPAANIVISTAGLISPTTAKDQEAVNRMTAQAIAKQFADLAVDLADNRRDFNELGYLRSVKMSSLAVAWNASAYNKMLYTDLPTIFNKDNLKPIQHYLLPARFFGNVLTSAGVANGTTTRSMLHLCFKADGTVATGSDIDQAVLFIYQGDLLPVGYYYGANEAYVADSTVACKIFPHEAVPFMSAFESGSEFTNARSLTQNTYLTWGHNTLERLLEKPFITMSVV